METEPINLPPGGMLRSLDEQPTGYTHQPSGRKVTGVLSPFWGTPELLVNLSYGGKTLSNVPAIIDSGAYRCMISPQMAQQLELIQPEGHAQYQNPILGTVQSPLYSIDFTIVGLDQPFTYACQIMPQMYEWGLLLGTEFLRQCTMHYYEKERYFELIV